VPTYYDNDHIGPDKPWPLLPRGITETRKIPPTKDPALLARYLASASRHAQEALDARGPRTSAPDADAAAPAAPAGGAVPGQGRS
jgi:hypothetical protein